ncbi:hypothetical protein FGO68_gene6525 [Halteria grandinella]|uniref:Uncharacterized protein n=1 Tax=Halteria grandinella TaxID=5974 RepID=A0A8J8NUE2_HALGN|nr:hypothetical protein FGO68_gene6525 [Halteria grandinella]
MEDNTDEFHQGLIKKIDERQAIEKKPQRINDVTQVTTQEGIDEIVHKRPLKADETKNFAQSTYSFIKETLSTVSLGKYQTKLYGGSDGNGQKYHSSPLSGLITLFLYIVFLTFAGVNLHSTLTRQNVTSNEYRVLFEQWDLRNISLREMMDIGYQSPVLNIYPDFYFDQLQPSWLNGWTISNVSNASTSLPSYINELQHDFIPHILDFLSLPPSDQELNIYLVNWFTKPFPANNTNMSLVHYQTLTHSYKARLSRHLSNGTFHRVLWAYRIEGIEREMEDPVFRHEIGGNSDLANVRDFSVTPGLTNLQLSPQWWLDLDVGYCQFQINSERQGYWAFDEKGVNDQGKGYEEVRDKAWGERFASLDYGILEVSNFTLDYFTNDLFFSYISFTVQAIGQNQVQSFEHNLNFPLNASTSYTMNLVHVKNDSSIIETSLLTLFGLSPPVAENIYITHEVEIKTDNLLLVGMAEASFRVRPVVTVIEIKPKGIIKTISEIGGLLIILKVSLLLGVFHERCFESKMKKKYGEKFKEEFSFEAFKAVKKELEEQRIINATLQGELQAIKEHLKLA